MNSGILSVLPASRRQIHLPWVGERLGKDCHFFRWNAESTLETGHD